MTGWPGREKGGAITQPGADPFIGQGECASATEETYQNLPQGWEGDLAATCVTPLIASVDSADLAG